VLLTITPSLPSPESSVVIRDTVEEPRVMAYAKHWEDSLIVHHPHNYVMPTAQDIHGTTVLICRYIHRQLPPHSVCDPATVTPAKLYEAMRRLARYVSMIPEKQDSSTFVGFCNLWATSSQFLQMMGGDDEEHAILLCNYFRSLPGFDPPTEGADPENEAFVVLGRGIPRGNSIYVLTRHRVVVGGDAATETSGLRMQPDKDGFVRLYWDPMTGLAYPINDHRCPLLHVDCIFNEQNIWANIQKANNVPYQKSIAKASTTDFDLKKPGWKPFFTKHFPRPTLTSYQIEQLG
jgi:coiled-coil and C2 domain-containing protein 2A